MAGKVQPESRFDIRMDGTGSWAVYDSCTGLTAAVNSIPLDGLTIDNAAEAADRLNAEYIARRKGTTH